MSVHIGRSFTGTRLEDKCPCPQEPCGLVDLNKADPACPEHPLEVAKTIRQAHVQLNCPGERE